MCFSHSSFQMASSALPAGSGTSSSTAVGVVALSELSEPEFGGSSLVLTVGRRFLNWSVMRQRVKFRSQAFERAMLRVRLEILHAFAHRHHGFLHDILGFWLG